MTARGRRGPCLFLWNSLSKGSHGYNKISCHILIFTVFMTNEFTTDIWITDQELRLSIFRRQKALKSCFIRWLSGIVIRFCRNYFVEIWLAPFPSPSAPRTNLIKQKHVHNNRVFQLLSQTAAMCNCVTGRWMDDMRASNKYPSINYWFRNMRIFPVDLGN